MNAGASGEQHLAPAFKALNPQGLVPAVEFDGQVLTHFRATIPFLLMVLAVLILVAAVPALSTWLPSVTTQG